MSFKEKSMSAGGFEVISSDMNELKELEKEKPRDNNIDKISPTLNSNNYLSNVHSYE
jgi:hypothetical protein